MNVHVQTADGIATICGDVIYDFNDQIVEPFHEISDAEPRVTAITARRSARKRRRSRNSVKRPFLLPRPRQPARIAHGQVVGRLDMSVPGPMVSRCPRGPGSRLTPAWTCHDHARRLSAGLRGTRRTLGAGAPDRDRFPVHRRAGLHPRDQYLLFSDMRATCDGAGTARACSEVMRPANKCNGPHLRRRASTCLVCEHADSSLVRERPDGRREPLRLSFRGPGAEQPERRLRAIRRLHLLLRSVLRPDAGLRRRAPARLELPGRLPAAPGGGEPQLLVDRFLFDQPNGLCFCPTEERLYVNDTVQALIRVFDMRPDGTPADPRGRVFAEGIRSELEPGVPDGMKCDARGNVWVTGPGGVWVYAPAASFWERSASRSSRATFIGAAPTSGPVPDRDALGLHGADQGRAAARTLHAAATHAGPAAAQDRPAASAGPERSPIGPPPRRALPRGT
jgi:hypothetical protein